MSLTIALIAPNSRFFVKFNQRLAYSLALGCNTSPRANIELIKHPGGFNASSRILCEKIEALVLEHDVDLIIAPVNTGLLADISPTLVNCDVPFIALTLGEDVSGYRFDCENIWLNSFGLWQSQWLLGRHCAELGYRDIVSSSAYHDSGYANNFAFSLGAESKGSNLVQFLVETKLATGIRDWGIALDIRPDAIYTSFSGANIDELYTQALAPKLPVFANLLGAGDREPNINLPPTAKVYSCTSWKNTQDDDVNRRFLKPYARRFNTQPNAYDLLAYEIGLVIGQLDTTTELKLQLPNAVAHGPRGPLRFKNNAIDINNYYLQSISRDTNGSKIFSGFEAIEPPALLDEHYSTAQTMPKSGWLNPYLVI